MCLTTEPPFISSICYNKHMDNQKSKITRSRVSLKLPKIAARTVSKSASKNEDPQKSISKEAQSATPNEAPGEIPNIRTALPKPKRETKSLILIIILVIAIAGLSAILAGIRISNNKEPIPAFTELTTSEDKSFYTAENLQEISSRASLILTKSTLSPDQVLNARIPYATIANLAEIQQDDKTAIAFAYADADENIITSAHTPTVTEALVFLGSTASDSDIDRFITTHSVISNYNVNKIAIAYRKIFDEDLDTSKRFVISSYGNSYYEPSNKSLYFISTADLTTESKIYKSSITKKDNNIFVDFVFVNCDAISNLVTNTLTTTCVDGFTTNEISDLALYRKNGLTYETYQNYTRYRLTFESDGYGNYLYKTVEIIDKK